MPFLRSLLSLVRAILRLMIVVNCAAALIVALRPSAGDWPFGPLDLDAPIGFSTHAKLARLDGDGGRCRALLAKAGLAVRALPSRTKPTACLLTDAIVTPGLELDPAGAPLACPLAAALLLWERDVVQPAAQTELGAKVARVEHLGSYACRRLYGRDTGAWSEHAEARAIDIAGFRLTDGRVITVARDWKSSGPRAVFLHRIRDGGCRLFSTTLSPDYNAAHRDHLHLDMAKGWGGSCQ